MRALYPRGLTSDLRQNDFDPLRSEPMPWLELLAVTLAVAALLSIVISTLRLGISPMPTSPRVRRAVLELVPRPLEGQVHELGAGWGTLAFALARRCPGATVIAWEASLFPYLFCVLRKAVGGPRNLMLRHANFFDADLRGAALVTAYLWTGAMTRLGPKFDAELPPGACVISHTFAWPGRTPSETVRVADLYRTPIYRYVIG